MTFLSKQLKKYFVRKGNRIVFKDNLSLNQLAILMWEELNYQGIDASVLSRVIKGERIFTTAQLEVFSNLLGLNIKERENLEYSMFFDNISRYRIHLPFSLQVSYDILDLFDSLLSRVIDYRLQGKNEDQGNVAEIIQVYIEKLLPIVKSDVLRKKMLDQLVTALYLKGHALNGVGLPKMIVNESINNVNRLFEIARETKNERYGAYGNILLAGAYYVAGNYSYSPRAKSMYLHSIIHAKQAYQALPDKDHEKLFALRNLVACSIYLRDRQEFINIKKIALNKLSLIPPATHFLNGINLYNLVAKGTAIFHIGDPWRIKETVFNHFRITFNERHIHEVSEIRSDLETFLALKTKDEAFLKIKVKKALRIAEEEHYPRHYISIRNIVKKLI